MFPWLMNSNPSTLRGALWMGGTVLSFAAMAVAVRELQRHLGPFEILFLRSVVMLLIVAAMVPRAGTVALRTQRPGTHVSRNLLHFAGQYCWVYAIGALTLATVFAIEFTMPVWVALLAAVFLGEHLRAHRLVQLACGLAGVLIILRPGADTFHPAALVMILGSFCYAGTMVFTKGLSATDTPLTCSSGWRWCRRRSRSPRRCPSGSRPWPPTCPGSPPSASAATRPTTA